MSERLDLGAIKEREKAATGGPWALVTEACAFRDDSASSSFEASA